MSHTKYVTLCTPFRLFPTCKFALVGAVLRDVKIFTPLCRYVYRSLAVSYTHLRAHETSLHLVCRLLLEKKK